MSKIKMKQTAVEWLEEQLNPDMKFMQGNIIQDLLEQAKEMEKEQSFEIFKAGQESMEEGGKGFYQYYETYKSE